MPACSRTLAVARLWGRRPKASKEGKRESEGRQAKMAPDSAIEGLRVSLSSEIELAGQLAMPWRVVSPFPDKG